MVSAIARPMPPPPAVTTTRRPLLRSPRVFGFSAISCPTCSLRTFAQRQNRAEHDQAEDNVAHRIRQRRAGEQHGQRGEQWGRAAGGERGGKVVENTVL